MSPHFQSTTVAREVDPVLTPYLYATGRDAERQLEALVRECVLPVIRGVVRRKWRLSTGRVGSGHHTQADVDAEDLEAEAVGMVLARLAECRVAPEVEHIADLRGYAAVTAYRACDMRLRKIYPNRWRLKSKLRYLLTHQPGLALWNGTACEWIAGFEVWKTDGLTPAFSDRLNELRTAPQQTVDRYASSRITMKSTLGDAAAAVFNAVGHPIELDELVTALAEILGEKDHAPETESSTLDEATPAIYEKAAAPVDIAREVGDRAYLLDLWQQIVELPPNQRAALLLNLRDAEGRGVVALFTLQGIASIREIADTVGMSHEQFAELWHDLPLEDHVIAGILNLTRQQVISLRKVARERLARRMRHYNE